MKGSVIYKYAMRWWI